MMTEHIIDLGGFDQFDLNDANVLLYVGRNTEDRHFRSFLEEAYPNAKIILFRDEKEELTPAFKEKIEAIHYSFIFALFTGMEDELSRVQALTHYLIEITEMMGSTTVLLMSECKPETENSFLETLDKVKYLVQDFNDFHLNPVSLLLFPCGETGAKQAELASCIARSQEAGVYASPKIAEKYKLAAWSCDD